MAFFNEFPHTRTYDSDLAWLIKRMKEVLSRMDSVEARMQEIEQLVNDFINTLNIPEEIATQLQKMIDDGTIGALLNYLLLDSERKIKRFVIPKENIEIQGPSAENLVLNQGEFYFVQNRNSLTVYVPDSKISGCVNVKNTANMTYLTRNELFVPKSLIESNLISGYSFPDEEMSELAVNTMGATSTQTNGNFDDLTGLKITNENHFVCKADGMHLTLRLINGNANTITSIGGMSLTVPLIVNDIITPTP